MPEDQKYDLRGQVAIVTGGGRGTGRAFAQALAEAACHIEMDLAGHPVGKHDHYLAAFGGFTNLEIDRDGKVRVTALGC